MKTLIETPLAPPALGPYSQAVVHRNILYVSGQIGLLPTGTTLPESFEEEVKNALYNLKSIIEAAGSKMERSVKVTVYLTDMANFEVMNRMYYRFFPENHPARECICVQSLPKGARVEISAMAYVRDDV